MKNITLTLAVLGFALSGAAQSQGIEVTRAMVTGSHMQILDKGPNGIVLSANPDLQRAPGGFEMLLRKDSPHLASFAEAPGTLFIAEVVYFDCAQRIGKRKVAKAFPRSGEAGVILKPEAGQYGPGGWVEKVLEIGCRNPA